MPNSLIDFWRQDQAAQGVTDDRPDYLIMRDELIPLAQQNPSLLEQYPDFAREFGAMRESMAPSLPAEAGRALKSGTQGLVSTAIGGLGLVTGSDYLKEKARSFDEDAGQNAPTISTLEDIAPGETGAGRVFSRDALRYGIAKVGNVAPSIAESVATAAAGAAIGSAAAPGPGTVAGAAAGVIEKSLIKAAIRSLLKKGVAEEMATKGLIADASEAGITQALRSGSTAVARDVAAEAAAIGSFRGGVAANIGSSFLLNAGDVASEGADTPTTLALGVVSALPDTIIPAYVLKKLFPGMAKKAAVDAGKTWLARNGVKLAELVGVPAEEFGQEYFQEAVNVVARNIKEGKDPLTFDDADMRRLREAGIGGAAGGLLAAPGVMFSGHKGETLSEPTTTPPPAPETGTAAPLGAPTPPAAPLGTARTQAEIYRAVNQMTPEEQQARLAELAVQPTRAPEEETEFQLLQALAPAPTVSRTDIQPAPAAPIVSPSAIQPEPTSAPAPVAPAAITPSPTEAGAEAVSAEVVPEKAQQTREEWLRSAISQPDATYQYTVMRMGEGYPDAIQVDVISGGKNLASADPRELRALGADLPEVPASLPQGRYTLEQIRAAATSPVATAPAATVPTTEAPAQQTPPVATGLPSAAAPVVSGTTEITPTLPAESGAVAVAPVIEAPAAPAAPAETFSRAQIAEQKRTVRALEAKAEQAANAGKAKRAVGFQEQVNTARERLAQMEENKLTGPSIPIGTGPEGGNDLLTDIAEIVGKIRTQAPEGNSANGGEYDLGNTFDQGAARLLRGGTEGTPASEAITQLNLEGGYKFGSVGEFTTAVDNAVAARKKFGAAFEAQAYPKKVEDAALTNTGRRAELKAKKGTPIADIGLGGVFFIRGEKFSVVDVTEDGQHYVVQDGHKFLVPAEAMVYPDRGTKVVSGAKPSTDFLSPEEEAALQAQAEAERVATSPKPGETQPTVPSATPVAPDAMAAAAKELQTAAKPFEHGKVLEGEPTVDLRSLENVTPEGWEKIALANMEQGTRGSTSGNRAETRIAIVLEGPQGQVVVTGLVKPQKVLNERGVYDFNAPAAQRMGVKEDGKRVVRDSGDSPALVREVVAAGWKPMAILHFEAAPGKIFERFANRTAFDAAWNATEKVAGPKAALPHAAAEAITARRGEAEIEAEIDQIGARLQEKPDAADRAALENRVIQLYDELEAVTRNGQSQTGDTDISGVQLRQAAKLRSELPIAAARAGQFQAVVARLRNMGARVDLFAREFFQQGSAQVIQQQIQALQQRVQAPETTAGQKAAIQRQIEALTARAGELAQASGAAFNPWHVAVALDDVQNASMGNLVTLLHEASEALAQRLNPAVRGRIIKAVNETMMELREEARASAAATGITVARETGALDRLSETLGQKLAAANIPDAPSLTQAIIRWVKDLYYRVAMAAQRAFGAEPSGQLALDWFENQLRREVFGDYDYRLARLLDQFMPETLVESVRRYNGRGETPGGVVDFLDPVSGKMRQPWVEPITGDALNWNVAFRQDGESPGGEEIPEGEARARIDAAALNEVLEQATKLHAELGEGMEWEKFWKIVGRGEDPKLLIGSRPETVRDARIGGERMTETMNGLARLSSRIMAEGMHLRAIRELAKSREAATTEADRVVSLAKEVNKLESDRRNAALHEETLKEKAKAMVAQLVRDYRRGLDTAQSHGELAQAVRQAEGLLESDPIPDEYQTVFKAIHDGDVSIFDYVRAIARLDLPISDLTVSEIVKAIRDNGDANETLQQLAKNKPLAVALASLVRQNADQVDEIQLGWLRDAEQYRLIHDDLQEIRRATPEQLRQLMANANERVKSAGLRERVKYRYLERRRALRTAQDRIDRAEERIALLESAVPRLAAWVEDQQKTGSTAPSEWYPREGAQWTALARKDDGTWTRSTKTLRFAPDGAAVDSDGVKRGIAENLAWLRENEAKAGGKFYETVRRQTNELAMLDVQQKYHIGWTSKVDRFTQTLTDEAQKLGRGGEEAARQLRQFQHITRSHREEALTNAHWWTRAFIDVGKAAGILDWGKLHEQLYNPINYFLNTNPGLDEAAAIRQATRQARARLAQEPAANFDDRFAELLRRTKQQSEFMLRTGEQYGSFTKDPRLKSELRRAVAQGWLTTPRSLRGELVATIIRDMQKAGWRLELREQTDSRGQKRQSVVRATTFEDLTPEDASDQNTLGLDRALQKYFTPEIVQRWLMPFVNKGGAEIFKWGDAPIPQADVQTAWENSGNSILRFIDNLAAGVKLDARGDEDPKAAFRLSILRQIDRLFGMEARLAYDASQVRNLFDPMGPKPHIMMDARLNDLLPQEHLEFAWFDPKSSEIMLSHVAFNAAFGRNGERMVSALNDLTSALQARKQEYQSLSGTTKNQRVAEAAARGWDYKELERGAQAADRATELQAKVQGILGTGNPAGPFADLRTGLELMQAMAGQIVDSPKVGLYNVLELFERPFAQRSLGPATIRASLGATKDIFKTAIGSLLEDFNLHLFHSSEYEKWIGSAMGVSQRNLPWDVTTADVGQKGRFQQTNADRWIIKPLRLFRYMQQKGAVPSDLARLVGVESKTPREFPRFSLIPGFGVLNSIMQIAAISNANRTAQQLELLIKKGIDYYSVHRDAASDPTFRFKPSDLRSGGLDGGVFDWFKNKTVEYGMGNLEDIVRDAMPRAAKGERLLTKDQVLRLSQMSATELAGDASIATTPSILATNPILRVGLPLLRWPIWKMHQIHEGLNTVHGQRTFNSVMRGLGALALWNLPMGIAFSFMLDEYDDKLLRKKSTLKNVDAAAAIPIVGPAIALATGDKSIPDNLLGFLQRSARAGNIYGLGADMIAQFAQPLDPSSGQRNFSLDQRVLAMSQFLNFQQSMRNLAAQDWTATWPSFWRPFFQSVGGNGVIHAVDLVNNALDLDNAEARTVMRINAGNYLRSAGAEIGLEVRSSGGGNANLPTPMSVWTREMLTAAMAGDRVGFMEAHQRALEAARKAVADDPRVSTLDREKEAESRVRSSWRSRDPMEVFRFRPTPAQTAALLGAMDDRGREDVQQALARFKQFDALITPSAAERSISRQFNRMTAPPRMRTPTAGSLLFSP